MVGFVILALVMVAGAIGVVALKQPVHAALALVATLLALAVTYVTLEAHFLAVIQVIVYAGAIMVLFLFVIMLLNVGQVPSSGMAWLRPAAYATGGLVAVGVGVTVMLERSPLPSAQQVASALRSGGADVIGEVLFSQYVLAFQLVGVLLLVGVVGAVSLVQRAAPETRPVTGAGQDAAGETTHG